MTAIANSIIYQLPIRDLHQKNMKRDDPSKERVEGRRREFSQVFPSQAILRRQGKSGGAYLCANLHRKKVELSSLMLPIKQVEAVASKREGTPLRKGYYRVTQQTFPSKGIIELTEDDLNFIKLQQNHFRFYSFQLLNPEQLSNTYILLAKDDHKTTNQEQLRLRVEQSLLSEDQSICATIFQLFQDEQPEMFKRFSSMLVARWEFKYKDQGRFFPNLPGDTVSSIVPFSLKQIYKQPRGRKPKSILRMRIHLHVNIDKINGLLEEYHAYREEYQRRRCAFIRVLMNFMGVLQLIEGEVGSDLDQSTLQGLSLEQIERRLILVQLKIKKWKVNYDRQQLKGTFRVKQLPASKQLETIVLSDSNSP